MAIVCLQLTKALGGSTISSVSERPIFEVPIYRVSHAEFNRGFDYDEAQFLAKTFNIIPPERAPESFRGSQQHFWEHYGGPWRYNQAVGWLRIYTLGSQLRADLWLSSSKRFLRRMQWKKFRLLGKQFELWIVKDTPSSVIQRLLLEEFRVFEREYKSRRLVLDLECFNNVAPFVDWHALVFPRTVQAPTA